MVLNATGISSAFPPPPSPPPPPSSPPPPHPPPPPPASLLTGGSGVINAFLFGSNVFTAPVNTCGYTDVDVLGVADGSLYGPSCSPATPLRPGDKGSISFSMQIPQEGQGLGTLNIIVNASDQLNAFAWCANLTLTL